MIQDHAAAEGDGRMVLTRTAAVAAVQPVTPTRHTGSSPGVREGIVGHSGEPAPSPAAAPAPAAETRADGCVSSDFSTSRQENFSPIPRT